MKNLSPLPARTDLTDRECSKLIGGLIGALSNMADLDTIRDAVRWWAEHDEPWEAMKHTAILPTAGRF